MRRWAFQDNLYQLNSRDLVNVLELGSREMLRVIAQRPEKWRERTCSLLYQIALIRNEMYRRAKEMH